MENVRNFVYQLAHMLENKFGEFVYQGECSLPRDTVRYTHNKGVELYVSTLSNGVDSLCLFDVRIPIQQKEKERLSEAFRAGRARYKEEKAKEVQLQEEKLQEESIQRFVDLIDASMRRGE